MRTHELAERTNQSAVLLADHAPAAPVPLETVLSQELLLGTRALAADAAALYWAQSDTGQLIRQADIGLIEALPAAIAHAGGLLTAAVATREAILVDDLLVDARWGAPPALPASGNGTPGADRTGPNGHPPEDGLAGDGASPAVPALGSNGRYRSALVLPLVAGQQALGALLFLSARPSAFDPASLPLAQAAAGQALFVLERAGQDRVWRQQAQSTQQWIAERAPVVQAPPAAPSQAARRLPAEPPQPPPVPARPMAAPPASPRAPASWRRLAPPAGALLIVLCLAGAALANRGALQNAAAGFLGGAATPTPTVTLVATPPSPVAPTLAPTTRPTVPATLPAPTPAPVVASPTPPASLTPAPTATEAPTASPTVTLPPDVIGLATVVLPEGIVGRLRDAPNGTVIGGVPGNTPVQVLFGRQTTPDTIVWVHIRVPSGQTGWFSEGLLQYPATPVP